MKLFQRRDSEKGAAITYKFKLDRALDIKTFPNQVVVKKSVWQKTALLLSSTMTVLAGSIIAPSLPGIYEVFRETPNVDVLSRLVLTLPALSIALFAPLSGWILDRFGRKKPFIISLILFVVAGTSGVYLDDLYGILIGRALLGVAVAGIMTTSTTLAGDYFEGEERSAFLGTMSAVMALGGGLFVLLGGVLADMNWRFPFYVYGIAICVIPIVAFALPEPNRTPQHAPTSAGSNTNISIGTIAGIYLLIFVGMLFFYLVPVQIPFFLETLPGDISKTLTGVAISLATLTAAFASIMYQHLKQRLSFSMIFLLAFLLIGIGMLIVYKADSYLRLNVAMLVLGLGAGLLVPNSNLWVISLADITQRGRLIGGLNMALFLGQFFSPIIFRPIQESFGLNAGFGLLGGVSLLICGLILLGNWFQSNSG